MPVAVNRPPNNVPDFRRAFKLKEEGLTQGEIGKKLGHNQSTISRWFNDKRKPKGWKYFELSEKQYELVEGELLGDGSIPMQEARNCIFAVESKVEAHVKHIIKELPEECFTSNSKRRRKYPKENQKDTYHLYTRSSPIFTDLRERWYPHGKKRIPPDLELTPRKTRYWYIGGGCLSCGEYHRELKITTCTFARESMERMLNQIKNKTGIEGGGIKEISSSLTGHSYNLAFYRKEDIKNFLKWIGKPKIKEYEYKWVEKCL